MAEHSNIAWTDATFNPWTQSFEETLVAFEFLHIPRALWLVVLKFVACVAKRHAVRYVEAECCVRGKRQDMVSPQIATPCVSALHTCVMVAHEYGVPPRSVFRNATLVERALRFTVLVARVICAAFNFRGRNKARTNFHPLGVRSRNATLFTGTSSCRGRDFLSALFGVRATLESRDAPLGRLADLHSSTRKTRRRKTVSPRRVDSEVDYEPPFFAACTPFQPCLYARSKFINRETGTLRGGLLSTQFSLCHVHTIITGKN